MKILVTGGAGFIGSNLVGELMKENEVVVFDDFSTGSFDNLQNVKFTGKVIKGDIMEIDKLAKVVKDYNIEQIYHLAATSSSQMFDKNLKRTIKNNVIGTLNVFDVARRLGVKRVVYASTSTVYAGLTPPFKEDMEVTPGNFYSFTKLVNELTGKIFSDSGLLETVGFRFFSVYGPNDAGKGEFANLMTQFLIGMKKGESPVVYDDGKQTRDFIYVKDLCKGMILGMNTPEANGEIVNLGTGIQTNILDLVEELNKLLGTKIKPIFRPNPIKGYVKNHQANTLKANCKLNFKIETILSEGLKKLKEALDESPVSK